MGRGRRRSVTSCSAGRCSTSTSPAASPSAPRGRSPLARASAVFPLNEAVRSLAGRARPEPDDRLLAARRAARSRRDLAGARLHRQRDRRAGRRRRLRSIPYDGRADIERRGAPGGLGARSSTTTRSACCAACDSRTSSASGSIRTPRSSTRAKAALVTRAAGERILDELQASERRRYRAPRASSGCSSRSAVTLDPRIAGVRLAVVPAGGHLRREPEAVADPGRPAPVRERRARGPRRRPTTPRARSTASGARTEPYALEALAYVGAPELAGAVEQAREARAGRAAPARRRARDRAGARRSAGCSS